MTMRNPNSFLLAAASAAAIAAPAFAQEMNEADILVTAQRENRTEVTREGSLGAPAPAGASPASTATLPPAANTGTTGPHRR